MAFEWQKGTNKYSGISGFWAGGDGGESYQPGSIDYANAAGLIGTDAADALYGAWLNGTVTGGRSGGMYETDQVTETPYSTTFRSDNFGIRGTSTAENAQITKQLLQRYYPNATQAELDSAAANALSKRGQHWNEVVLPSDIVRSIGGELGGLSAAAEAELKTLDPKFMERAQKITEARNDSDDASSGVTGFLNDLGPLKYGALLVPGGAGLLGAATAISGAEQGDPLKMALGGLGAYYGFDQPGLFQPGGAVEKIGGMFGGDTAALTPGQISGLDPANAASGTEGFTLDQSMLDPNNLAQYTNTAGIPTNLGELSGHLGELIPGTGGTWGEALKAGNWTPEIAKSWSEKATDWVKNAPGKAVDWAKADPWGAAKLGLSAATGYGSYLEAKKAQEEADANGNSLNLGTAGGTFKPQAFQYSGGLLSTPQPTNQYSGSLLFGPR